MAALVAEYDIKLLAVRDGKVVGVSPRLSVLLSSLRGRGFALDQRPSTFCRASNSWHDCRQSHRARELGILECMCCIISIGA